MGGLQPDYTYMPSDGGLSVGLAKAWPLRRLHECFETLADHQPTAPAILTDHGTVGYAELDARANALAHALLARGVIPEEAVGVLAERSADLPVAFLAILKAGAAYVPMVADLPAQRLADMAEQSRMRLLIALDGIAPPAALLETLSTNAPAGKEGAVLRPENLDPAAMALSGKRPALPGSVTDLAAILFTSGSTGHPKGVLLQHDAALNMGLGHRDAHGIVPADRLLLSASPGFILGFRELCLPLLSGAAFVPVSRAVLDDPVQVLATMSRHRVSVALFTPSYLRLLHRAVPTGLRCLLTAGERPIAEDARHYARHVEYWNIHGATEMCGAICMHRVEPDGDGPLPSGRPFVNTEVRLLDAQGREVAPGEIGEIHVLGRGLARGYLRQPELTAASFVETDFGRAYRSHDLGRWTAGGLLETIGRADDVVKVSGQSVSLSEIERSLLRHDAISHAAAIQHEGRLIAFVETAAAPAEDWRDVLARTLPSYMLPAQVAALPRMPVNSSGKVDRRALRLLAEQALDARHGADGGTPPQGEEEERVARVWQDILKIPAIMRTDNFFAVGGTSLLAIAVSQRLTRELGLTVPTREIFAAPVLADLAGRVAVLRDRDSGVPLPESDVATEGEREFWVAETAGLDTQPFTIALHRVVRGGMPPLDRWAAAWAALVERHPALRTHFEEDAAGTLRRKTAPNLVLGPRGGLDVAELPDRAAALAAIRDHQARPFSMARPPLWRAGLVTVTDSGEHLFWLALHHSVGDRQSVGVIVEEMEALLRQDELPPPSTGFGEAAAREEAYLASPDYAEDARFWRDTLAGLPDRAYDDWPLDLPRSATAAPSCHRLQIRLDPAVATGLKALARRHAAGLHAVLLALLAHEVRRRTGREDFVVGTTASARETAAEGRAIGYGVNMLPLPCRPRPTPFGPRLREAQEVLGQGLLHARYPFAHMYHPFWEAHPGRHHPARYPIFDLVITENPEIRQTHPLAGLARLATGAEDGITYESSAVSPGQDMVLIHESLPDGGLLLQWHVNAALYTRRTAESWFEGLTGWIDWLIEDPDRADTVPPHLLPDEARRLCAWEYGAVAARPHLRFHELFERRLDQPGGDQAERPAILTPDATLTYRAVEDEANLVAHLLLARGLRRGEVVGVVTDRSPNLPAVVLGIWKAGGTYLPLAADLPPERLNFMARDAGATQVIALDGHAVPAALALTLPPVLRPEDSLDEFRRAHRHRPAVAGAPGDVAYVIYTSGSTGQPKGARITHAAYLNMVLGAGEMLGLSPDDRTLFLSSPSFDVSLSDLGVPLAHGAALCPVSYDVLSSPRRFRDLLAELAVTVADITPTYLRLLGDADLPPSLHTLVTGGEAPILADMRKYAGRLRYFNAYGPTENTITSTMGLLDGLADFMSTGRPLPNTSVHVTDPDGNSVPPGVVGEIRLGGAGLAAGYVNQPELTAAAFVDTVSGRRYRSGDLGRWHPSGTLEILGRSDDQVKLNGIRVELGEIEHALGSHPQLAQAVVVVEDDAGGGHSLWAFVQPWPGMDAPTEEAWRAHLADRLPAYMIPAAVTVVSTIPVSRSGKVDKAALKALLAGRSRQNGNLPPRSGLEQEIARLWSELLGRDDIRRDDNFFALGGHSLLAIAVAHRLEKSLGRPVPARELFAEPTLEGFAARIGQSSAERPSAPAASDRATEGQREFWTAEQAGLDTRGYTIPLILAVHGTAPEPALWPAVWAALVARHAALRTRFFEDGDAILRRDVLPVLGATLELDTHPDRDAALAHIRRRQAEPFAMSAAPLWRAGLVTTPDGGEPLFWLALHHSVGDGVSLGVLTEDLATLLRGESLPPPAGSFDNSAAQEERYLDGPACRADALYWREVLTGLGDGASADDPEPYDDWPLDHPRPSARLAANAKGGHCFRVRLDAATGEGLRAFAQRNGASLHTVMLTIMAQEVRRRTGRTDFLLGTAASTRETADEAQVLGYYVNMLPVPCRVRPAESVEHSLRLMQRTVAEGLQHARYPFARMYGDFRSLRPRADQFARYPLFDLAVTENPALQVGVTAEPRGLRLDGLALQAGDAPQYEFRRYAPAQDMVLVHEGQADGGLVLSWHVNATLYEPETARAWIDSLAEWARVLAGPDRRADSPPPALLPGEERVLATWRQGPALPLAVPSFHELFRQQARRQPDRPAVVTDDRTVSFAAMDARANALAHVLLEHGVTRGQPVGILTERSAALPEAALAIWKAGGAYLPLSVDLPAERLAFIAHDAGIRVLMVLDGHPIPAPLAEAGYALLRPENIAGSRPDAPSQGRTVQPSDLAYIIYTSGSTGQPKGVMINHGGLNNLTVGVANIMMLRPEDRVLMMSSPTFDAWIFEVVMAWTVGAAVVPVTRTAMDDIAGMKAAFERLGVSVATMSPSYLRLFEQAEFPSLRVLTTVGEPPIPQDALHYAERLRYLNGYGPTENTVVVSIGWIAPGSRRFATGRPLANTCVHILNRHGEPVPPGAIGRVWLGGAGLATGYLNRPDLTAAAFVETAAGRLYDSGDLGRWTDGGELEILGRMDGQVKLRGQRVELGEIEHRLERQPGVRQAVALVDTQEDGTQTLWAFVHMDDAAPEPTQDVWRDALAEALPSYMIPAAIIRVAAIPVTIAGKVDKPALKSLLVGHARPADASRLPEAGLEQEIAQLWSALLKCGPVHRDDNFFALGGQSLLAIAVAHRLEKTLGRPVPARELFIEPTLEGFAARVGRSSAENPSTPTDSDRATEGQREFWTAEQAGLDTRGFTIPLILAVHGTVPEPALWPAAWAVLVARHAALRTRFFEDGDAILRREALASIDAVLELDTRPDRDAALAHIRHRQSEPFAMSAAPLWRAGLTRTADDDRHFFWLALHHSVGDGLSLGLLADELATLLRGESLPPLSGSFDRSAALEERYLDSPASRADSRYWRDLLAGLGDAFDEWPLDHPRTLGRSAEEAGGHVYRTRLDAATAAALRAFAHGNGASLHALMLTIMALEVRRRTGRPDVLLGTAASTRETSDEAQVLGYYVNMLPVPCRVDRAEPLEQTLRATQRALAEGLQHVRYPFARMYQDVRRERPQTGHPARYPLFDLAVTETPPPHGGGETEPGRFRFATLGAPADDALHYDRRRYTLNQDMVLVHEGQADGGLVLSWFVNAALYERETARAWIESLAEWARFLAGDGCRPDAPPPALLPGEEKVLATWRQGPTLPLTTPSFHELFRQLAHAQPDRPAVVTEGQARSFAAIEARANALAHALLERGVTRGRPVGILTDRSVYLPEAVLAVWKAGAAYLPLSVDLPAERLAFIAHDAGIRVLIVLDGHAVPAPLAEAGYAVLRPESIAGNRPDAPSQGRMVQPSDLAYVIYTSGSTGQPKGVMLPHGGLNNLGAALAAALDIRSADRALLMASPAFDAWISDLVMAWAAGAAVVPVTRAEMDDVGGMKAKLERLGVSVATMPPSYLRLFEQADFPGLRLLMTVGEPPHLSDALHYAGRLDYINGYGPTENTAAATVGRVPPGARRLTAGRPLANTEVHILDERGTPLPPGAVGKVWLGGAGLAIGYLNRPDLTAAAFVETASGRLYDTGDLGRWTETGELMVLGRSDGQVKLRGQRVELGEIEHRLESLPGVRQAVALVETGDDATQTLWAFAHMDEEALDLTPAGWHDALAATLPSYMIPAAIIRVAAIPVTEAGKVDRAALLAVAAERGDDLQAGGRRTPPANGVEKRVAQVWAAQFDGRAIAREDNFFDLGGDSLRVIAAVNQLRREFHCAINDLYEHPVLADFSHVCRRRSDHLQALLQSVKQHWQGYHDGLAAYEATRSQGMAEAFADYRRRNRPYLDRDLRTGRDTGTVLLTGATGYLGSYLLRELLAEGHRDVATLVRGGDDRAARARLGQVLTHYFGPADGAALLDNPRLTVRAGDLRRDGLGLPPVELDRLADGLGAVFHCAANVNHFGHYREFHADNVAATERLLRLAARQPAAPADFHFVSTLSVVGRAPETGTRLFTEYDAPPDQLDENYYIRTKQEAERLVVAARGELANASIHRVGNVVFAAEGGPLQRNVGDNAFFCQLGAFLRLGMIPDDYHAWMCHVDLVARAVVRLAGAGGLANETHHVEHSRRDTLAEIVTASEGMADKVRSCRFDAFLDRLAQAVDEPEMEAVLGETLENFRIYAGGAPQPRARRLDVATERTQTLLTRLGLVWPSIPPAGMAALLRAAGGLFPS